MTAGELHLMFEMVGFKEKLTQQHVKSSLMRPNCLGQLMLLLFEDFNPKNKAEGAAEIPLCDAHWHLLRCFHFTILHNAGFVLCYFK